MSLKKALRVKKLFIREHRDSNIAYQWHMSQDFDVFRRRYVLLLFTLTYAWLNNDLLGKMIWGLMPVFGLFWYCVIFTNLPIPTSPKPKFLEKAAVLDMGSEALVDQISLSLFPAYPDISNEIDTIVDLIIQNFVMSWFSHIDASPSSAFPKIVRTILLGCVERLQKRLVRKDEANLIVLKLLPLMNKHFDMFCSAKEAVLSDMTFAGDQGKNVELSIAVEFDKNYKLHKALSLRSNCLNRDIGQYVKLKMENFIPYLVDNKELESPFVSVLLREIVSSCIVEPLIVKFSDPDTWNLKFISISDKILEEHDQVDEIRKILSKEVEEQKNPSATYPERIDGQNIKLELVPELSNKQFEDFLRRISSLTSFAGLQSTKYSFLIKLLQLKNRNGLPKTLLEYRNRLLLSLNLIQTRLMYVNDKCHRNKMRTYNPKFGSLFNEEKEIEHFEAFLGTIALKDVLEEPFCFAFFEQYLSQTSMSRGLTYLKYWKLVETLKNPLEDAFAEDISVMICDDEISNIKSIALNFFQKNRLADMNALDPKLVHDVAQLKGCNNSQHSFLVASARRSMLLLQVQSQKTLDGIFFFDFKRSTYFLDMISNPAFSSTDVYARLIDLPSAEKADTKLRNKKSVDAARILTHPDIDDALDRILNDTAKNSRRRSATKSKPTSVTLFGNEDDHDEGNIFNDTLFGNDDKMEAVDSVLENCEIYEPSECLLSSISSRFRGNSDSSGDRLQNSSHTFVSLKDDIAKLTLTIDQIEKELELLDHLILKADLTNNQNQLKLLRKSQKALLKDLDNRELLRQQYLVQENASILYGKTKICIKTYFVDTRLEDGREVTYYLLDVEHVHQGQVTTWEIPRRFSEFFKLNLTLKKRYKNQVKHLQKKDIFPEKVKMSLKYHVAKSLLHEERKTRLERYLRELLAIPDICQDDMFRVFLTDSRNFDAKYNPTNDQLLNLCEESSTNFGHNRATSTDFQVRQFDANYEDEVKFYEDDRNFYHNTEANSSLRNKSFVKPICNVFISVFSLDRSNSGWLRGKTIITVLQQLLGSTIEKYVKNSIRRLRSEDQILRIILLVKDSLWGPLGSLARRNSATPVHERTKGEKARTRADAQVILQSLFAETFGKVVGLRAAHEAALNIHGMAQNPYLMASLLLEILDTVINDICANETDTTL